MAQFSTPLRGLDSADSPLDGDWTFELFGLEFKLSFLLFHPLRTQVNYY